MSEDQKHDLGALIDELDNLAHALQLPLPPSMHVEALRNALPEKVESLKRLFYSIE